MKTLSIKNVFGTGLIAASMLLTSAQAGQMPEHFYRVEEIPLPKDVAPEVGGLAFNSKGELVVVVRRHGILIGKPSSDPDKFEWRKFSDVSLHNPMGLLLESDSSMLIPQMPELTRVSDTDGDGVADSYECVSTAWGVSGNYHETNAGPVPDGEGNWFVAVGTASHNGPTFDTVRGEFSRHGRRGRNFSSVSYKGWVLKIKPDGKAIPWAKGFRANNGIAMSPDGDLFVTDNQGDWRGTSPIFHIEKGNFYGHPSSLVWDPKFYPKNGDPLNYPIEELDKMRTRAAVELPQGMVCNSPAQPIFDTTGGAFGPFTGQMFVGDIAGQRILRVMLEKVNGEYQGAVSYFIDRSGLRGGNNRFVWSPDGGSLYVGQTYRGWGRPAEGLQRIVYNGHAPMDVHEIHLTKSGFNISFTRPLDPKTAIADNLRAQSYYYEYGHKYGSPQMDKRELKITSLKLGPDNKSFEIEVSPLQAKRIVQIDFDGIAAPDGHPLINPMLCYTLNQLKD